MDAGGRSDDVLDDIAYALHGVETSPQFGGDAGRSAVANADAERAGGGSGERFDLRGHDVDGVLDAGSGADDLHAVTGGHPHVYDASRRRGLLLASAPALEVDGQDGESAS